MIRLRSLGECVLELDGAQLLPDAEVLFGTALYLVVERERTIERGALLRLLWPAATERQASHNLRQALYRLRAMGAPIVGDRTRVGIATDQVAADYDFLQRSDGHVARELLLQHVHGGFLRTYTPTFSAPFRDWLERQRHVIDALARRALVGAILTERGRGEWRTVDALARVCLEVDPLNEEATLALAEATALAGGKSQALAIIDEYLQELGPAAGEIRLPAILLRRRVAETAQYSGSLHTRPVPFVGRSADIAMLSRALHRAQSGRGNGILLWGEPGIGKTRLVSEFTGPALVRRAVVARASCQAMDEKRPLSAFVDLVPRLLALPGGLGVSPETMSYLRRLTEHDSEQTTLSPEAADAEFLFASIRRALTDLLDAVATEEALIVLIEDVQWLDVMSWKLLEEFLPWMEQRRILLLLTGREGDVPERRGIVQIPTLRRHLVAPLEPAAARDLVRQVVTDAGREASDAFLTWCASAGGGNPYYLRELALHAIEEGGSYQAPGTLMDLITERLQRLRPSSLRVLQACAILGQHSTLERVEAVVGMGRAELLDSLDELEGHRIIVARGARAVVHHELLAKAALERLSPLARVALHHYAADALASPGTGDDPTQTIWEIAQHRLSAGEGDAALEQFRLCANHATAIGLPRQALEQIEHAISLCGNEYPVAELLEEKITLASIAGQLPKVVTAFEQLRALRGGVGGIENQHRSTAVLHYLRARFQLGLRPAQLFAEVRSFMCAPEMDDSCRRELAIFGIALADNEFEPDSAAELYHAAFDDSTLTLAPDFQSCRATLVYHTSFGDVTRGSAAAREILRHVDDAATSADLRIRWKCNCAFALHVSGDTASALKASVSAYEEATQLGMAAQACRAAVDACWICLRVFDFANARHWHELSLEWMPRCDDTFAHAMVHGNGCRLAIAASDFGLATAELRLATSEITPHGSCRATCQAAALSAHVHAIEAGWELPAPQQARLLALYERARNRTDQDLLCHAILRSLVASGDSNRARDVLKRYVHVDRRDRYPLPPDMDSLTRELLA